MVRRRKRGRPATGRRPVIAIRVQEDLNEKIVASAAARGRSLSAEAEARLRQSFEWEQVHGDVRRMMEESKSVLKRGFEAALRDGGYQRIQMDQGAVWAEPGMDWSLLSISVDATAVVEAAKGDLVQAIARALGRSARKGSEK